MDFKWSNRYLSGEEYLDCDRKKIFQMANKVKDLLETNFPSPDRRRNIIIETLKFLKSFFLEYTRREENYMIETEYSSYYLHKHLHSEFFTLLNTKFDEILEAREISRKESSEIFNVLFGWLFQHLTMTDMLIFRNIPLGGGKKIDLNKRDIENTVNSLITSFLNLDLNSKIVDEDYTLDSGSSFTNCTKIAYEDNEDKICVISGMEDTLLEHIGAVLLGDATNSVLQLATAVSGFSIGFWRILAENFIKTEGAALVEHRLIFEEKDAIEEYRRMIPTVSLLFECKGAGHFFVATDSRYFIT